MNLLVSGMVTANGRPVLLDSPLDKGSLARRAFTTHVDDGALELRFGGATGFGLAALAVERVTKLDPEPLAEGGVRHFELSPRHPNPDWLPLGELVPKAPAASEVSAADSIPLVDLGTLAQAPIGDVVAHAEISAPARVSRAARRLEQRRARVLNGEPCSICRT